ncbi:MAG TPA: hypothetical protein VMQ45_01705 [Burkholderiaceae bacterium]|nr:hypothetical protein [Burkholderiaceae bacterium]
MEDPRAGLTEIYRDMSDEELIQRWADGYLTQDAMEVARQEFSRRGVEPPQVKKEDLDDASGPEETVTFVTLARSLVPGELQVLRARLESDGIASFVVDDNINRMTSLWSIAVGGARLLVPKQFAAEARQIIDLVKSGRLALREGDDTGDRG